MQLPFTLLESLKDVPGFNLDAFEKVHSSGEQVTSIRIHPNKLAGSPKALSFGEGLGEVIPWTQYGYYLKERPSFTFDPLFHAGCYYVQEASSMFLEQALKQTVDLSQPVKVLDLCAAPGGKSTHIHSLISKESLLVSNEVIRSRSNILKDNIIKWGSDNVVVTNNDPKAFAKLENYFDVIVIDAPCSGSGLFRKDEDAINEWGLNNVHLCRQRQQRILADVWPALKKNGVLIYCTCSYSKEENEEIIDWMKGILQAENIQLNIYASWGVIESSGGYRFWPDKVKGEGFFISCLRKKEGDEYPDSKNNFKPDLLRKDELNIVKEWMQQTNDLPLKLGKTIFAVPEVLLQNIYYLTSVLNVIYQGIAIGELIRDKMIPEHALAMSNFVNPGVRRIELNKTEAVEFLRKKNIHIDPVNKGWSLVAFNGCNLGWVNVLANRVNNYYPKSLRILKDK